MFDSLGQTLDPVAYEGWWYSSASLGRQIFDALAFTNQSWLNNTRIGTNGPYWSLAYEVWYYVAFACLSTCEAWRHRRFRRPTSTDRSSRSS